MVALRDPIAVLKCFLVPYYERPGSDFVTVECCYHNEKHHVKDDDVSECTAGINRRTGAFKCFHGCTSSSGYGVLAYIATRLGITETIAKAQFDNITGDAKPGDVMFGI